MAEQFSIPTPGDILAGKYLIEQELGRGSYGVVFKARQLGVERDVALKTLLPQAFLQTDIVERFQREAAMISRLTHPNIVTLYDFGEADGILYMAMEFIRGQQLNELVKSQGPLPPARATHIARQILEALQVAHKRGIVHRDLKPENIILHDTEQVRDFTKVLDFGIAKMIEPDEALGALKTLTIQGYVLGTPHYMSPETITGDAIDHRADLYAVGLLLYEMLTGVHPFDAPKPSAVLLKHLNDPVPALPDPEMERSHLGYAIRTALAKDPAARMDSAEAFIEILDGDREPPPAPPIWQRRPALVAALGGLIALALVLLGWGLSGLSLDASSDADAGVAALDADHDAVADRGADLDAALAKEVDAAPDDADLDAAIALRPDAALRTSPLPVRDAGPAPQDAAHVAPAETPQRVDRTVLRFLSDPPGATVILDGRPVGPTPCTALVQGQEPVSVAFKKIGFRTQSVSVTPRGGPQTVNVKLRPGRLQLNP